MKRLLLVITTIIFMVAILCGCNHENKEPTTTTQGGQATESYEQKSNEIENDLSDETYEAEIDFSEFE